MSETKERIALFTKYFLEDGKPITVKQLCSMAERHSGFRPQRKTVYDDLNAIDIAIGLKRECVGVCENSSHRLYLWSKL